MLLVAHARPRTCVHQSQTTCQVSLKNGGEIKSSVSVCAWVEDREHEEREVSWGVKPSVSDSGEKSEGPGVHQSWRAEQHRLRAQARCERQYQESYEQLWKEYTKEADWRVWTSLKWLQTRNKCVGAAALLWSTSLHMDIAPSLVQRDDECPADTTAFLNTVAWPAENLPSSKHSNPLAHATIWWPNGRNIQTNHYTMYHYHFMNP